MRFVLHAVCAVLQFLAGWFTPLLGVAALRRFTKPQLDSEGRLEPPLEGWARLGRTLILCLLGSAFWIPTYGVLLAVRVWLRFAIAQENPTTTLLQLVVVVSIGAILFSLVLLVLEVVGAVVVDRQGTETREEMEAFGAAVGIRMILWRFSLFLLRAFLQLPILGLSLLPLSALLLAYPAINPQESVLTDAVSTRGGWLVRVFRRLSALFIGGVVALALLVVSVEVVSRVTSDAETQRLLPEQGSFRAVSRAFLFAPISLKPPPRPPEEPKADASGKLPTDEERRKAQEEREAADKKREADEKAWMDAQSEGTRKFLTTPLADLMPPAVVEHWPFVILGVYLLDVGVLLLIGRVPLAYNVRNLSVRWKTNAMTAFAFACVVGLLSFLLAFVNGMNRLTEGSGVPGNVFVLSDGSTDEVFSNLGYGDLGNVERARVGEELAVDAAGKPVLDGRGQKRWKAIPPLVIRSEQAADGQKVYWSSKETYYSVNMAVPNSERRRFVQLRAHEDADISAKVHAVELQTGRWYAPVGVDENSRVECVVGAGIAKTFGEDVGKAALVTGDTFELGDMTWVIVGIMKSEGKTFGSEIWVKKFDRVTKTFGKEKYTTMVLRTEKDTRQASRAFANFLNDQDKYPTEKLKAFSEPDYYAEQSKTNNFFLTCVLVVCVVMAIGGVFGMMTTMFASIAQRIRDIGVLRLLGFKRWQVMVSFLLEGLAVAAVGGLLGVLVAWLLADGRTATSTLSGGGGGPGGKTIALTISVDAQVIALALLFTFVMGRLGGLVPALSAMRMKILDSLR